MAKVENLSAAKKRLEQERYNRTVLKAFDDLEHDDKRDVLERRSEVERKARDRI